MTASSTRSSDKWQVAVNLMQIHTLIILDKQSIKIDKGPKTKSINPTKVDPMGTCLILLKIKYIDMDTNIDDS